MEKLEYWIANDPTAVLFAVVIIAIVAGLIGWLSRSGSVRALKNKVEEQRGTIESAAKELAGLDAKLADWSAMREEVERLRDERAKHLSRIASDEATLQERQRSFEAQLAQINELKKQMTEQFQGLALQALKTNQSQFLEVANETLSKHRQAADSDLKTRQDAITNLLKPVEDTLKRYERNLSEIEKSRQEAYGALSSELKQVASAQLAVREEAGKLVNALRAAPKTRGRWGEHQLRNVLELSGMTAYVDFDTQVSMDGEDGRLIPDAVIRLPGERAIVVDAKTSMSAYIDAFEASDEDVRERHLIRHARHIRDHMKQLGTKRYWDALDVTPDFVAMFIPGENFFAAAIERDPNLFEDGVANRVLIVTPTTMIALAKAIAYGWRQESMAENAIRIAELGRDLYRRLAKMGEHVSSMGKSLDGAVRKYNDMVGSLERNVLPQARKFQELQVEGTGDAIAELNPIETESREPIRGKDLLFAPDDPEA